MRLYGEATTFDENALTEEFNTKRQNFTSQPVPPYAIGDLWTQGETGDIMVCRFARYTGGFSEDDWEYASKYTDDSALEDWLTGDYADDLEEIQGQIDSKAETWYQSERPDITESWTAEEKEKHVGDLWYNTTANTTWRYNGTAWVQQNVPTAVFDAIDGKAQVFTGNTQPSNPSEGDLWFKSASDPIKTYVNNQWVEYNKYTDNEVANSKNRTFIGSSPPTAQAIGDMWIDTSDDNHQKRWDGTSWVSVRDETIAEAALTADSFITENANGIFVHRDGQSDDPATGTGVWITDAISIVRSGLSYLWAGVENNIAKIRIGLVTAAHVILDSTGMSVKDASGNDVAKFGEESVFKKDYGSSQYYTKIGYDGVSLAHSETDTETGDESVTDGLLLYTNGFETWNENRESASSYGEYQTYGGPRSVSLGNNEVYSDQYTLLCSINLPTYEQLGACWQFTLIIMCDAWNEPISLTIDRYNATCTANKKTTPITFYLMGQRYYDEESEIESGGDVIDVYAKSANSISMVKVCEVYTNNNTRFLFDFDLHIKHWYYNNHYNTIPATSPYPIHSDYTRGSYGSIPVSLCTMDTTTVNATTINATTTNSTTVNATNVNATNVQCVRCGVTQLNSCNANANRNTTITFNTSFSSTPCVVACFAGDMEAVAFGNVQLAIVSRSETGFTVRMHNNTNATRQPWICWIATTSGMQ